MTAPNALVLVIEDDRQLRRFLRALLEGRGLRVFEAETGKEGLAAAAGQSPAVILLDLGLPDQDGLDTLKNLREWSRTPVIVLSAREQENQKVAALDLGADDYLTKPFGSAELLARLRVALRHGAREESGQEASDVRFGRVHVDLVHRRVFVTDVEVKLTPIEYKLLILLLRHAGKVLTHRQILKEIWGEHSTEESHYVRVFMAQLRRKLEADPARPQHLLTETGVGYRLVIEPS